MLYLNNKFNVIKLKQIFSKLPPVHFRLNHQSPRNHPQSIHHHHHPAPPHSLWYRLNKVWVQKMTTVLGRFPVQVSQEGWGCMQQVATHSNIFHPH